VELLGLVDQLGHSLGFHQATVFGHVVGGFLGQPTPATGPPVIDSGNLGYETITPDLDPFAIQGRALGNDVRLRTTAATGLVLHVSNTRGRQALIPERLLDRYYGPASIAAALHPTGEGLIKFLEPYSPHTLLIVPLSLSQRGQQCPVIGKVEAGQSLLIRSGSVLLIFYFHCTVKRISRRW
jgi:hypothetical protein